MSNNNIFATESVSEGESSRTYETVAELNKAKLETMVTMKINPHPLIIVLGVLVTIIIVYGFWVFTLQSSPEGIWVKVDNTKVDNTKVEISHSKIFGTITIMGDGKNAEVGTLNGSVLTIGEGASQRRGMWDTNQIYWVSSSGKCSSWTRELTLI
jgi:hypothetical protein